MCLVDIWTLGLDIAGIAPNIPELLSPDELERTDRFLFNKDRNSFQASRLAMRCILGKYLDVAPASISFSYGATGKPELAGVHAGKIYFSLSHSENFTILAFTRDCEIGVDVEYVRDLPDLDQIAIRYFPAREVQKIRSLPVDSRTTAFYKFWTRREALIKGMGKSLTVFDENPEDIAMHQSEQSTSSDLRTEESDWTIIDMYPAPDYVAAVAARNRNIIINCKAYISDLLIAA